MEDEGGYDAADPRNGGITYERGMARMRAVKPDGTVLTGVPVFEEAYRLVGLGWVYAFTRVPLLRWFANKLYSLFARYRTEITRGATLEDLIRIYNDKEKMSEVEKKKGSAKGEEEVEGGCIPCREKSTTTTSSSS